MSYFYDIELIKALAPNKEEMFVEIIDDEGGSVVGIARIQDDYLLVTGTFFQCWNLYQFHLNENGVIDGVEFAYDIGSKSLPILTRFKILEPKKFDRVNVEALLREQHVKRVESEISECSEKLKDLQKELDELNSIRS